MPASFRSVLCVSAALLAMCVALSACSGSGAGTASAGSAVGSDPCVGDAGPLTARASCVYAIASDAATLSACDEWLQAPGGDWSTFIETCSGKNGALAATPCDLTGAVGSCAMPPSCDEALVTFDFGASGAVSFEHACDEIPGATWTSR